MSNLGDLRVGLGIGNDSLKNFTLKIKKTSLEAGNEMEKNLSKGGKKGLNNIKKEGEKTIKTIGGLNNKLSILNSKLNTTKIGSKRFQELQKEIKKTEGTLNNVTNKTSLLKKSFGGLKGIITGLFAVTGISKLVSGIVTLGSKFEQAQISFTTMLGSAEQAKKTLNDLNEFAKNTPFEIVGLRNTAKQLLAFGFNTEELIPTLKSLGDVSAGLSVPIEQIAYAYGQVRVANQLYGTELMQFTQAGVPLLAELAKMFGKTEAEVKKMVENGKVGFKDVEKAFGSMSGEGGKFFNLMDKQSKSVAGQWSNLKDTATQLGEKIGSVLLPALQKGIDLLNNIIDFTKEYSRQIGFLLLGLTTLIGAKGLFGLYSILFKLIPAIRTSSIVTGLLSTSVNLSTISMRAFVIASGPLLGTLALITSALWGAKKAYDAYASALDLIDATDKIQESQDALYKIIDKGVDKRKNNISELKKQNEDLIKSEDKNAKRQIEINNKKIQANKNFLKANLALATPNSTISAEQRNKLNKEGIALIKEAKKEQSKLGGVQVSTGKKSIVTIGGLNKGMELLKDKLENTGIGTDEFKKLKDEIEKTENQIKSLTGTSSKGSGKQKEETKELKNQVQDLKEEYNDYEKQIKDLDNSQEKYNKNTLEYQENLETGIRKTNNSLKDQENQYKTNIDLIEQERIKRIGETKLDTDEKIAERKLEIEKERLNILEDIIKATKDNSKFSRLQNKLSGIDEKLDGNISEEKRANLEIQRLDILLKIEEKLKDQNKLDSETFKLKEKLSKLDKENIEIQKLINGDILNEKRTYEEATELGKILIDQKKELKNINGTQDTKKQETTDKFEKEKQNLEDYKIVYEAFQNEQKITTSDLEKVLLDERFLRLSQEEQDLIIKLAKEKISLGEQKDYILGLENEINEAKINLSNSTTEILKNDVSKLSNDYKKLIKEIQRAIEKQKKLNALKGSSNSGGTGFAEGGYTGDGGKHEVAGKVHKGEYVINQAMLQKMPNIIPALETVRKGENSNSISNDYSKKIDVGNISLKSEIDLELFFEKLKFKM